MAATYPNLFLADLKVPAVGGAVYSTDDWPVVIGVHPYRARAAQTIPVTGATGFLSRWMGMTCDFVGSGPVGRAGRHLKAWPMAGTAIAAGSRRLLGGANVDAPDHVVMEDAILTTDGQGRWLAGTAPFAFVFGDDGGAFTDESTDAQDPGGNDVAATPVAALAVNDALYLGAAATFAGYWALVTTLMVLGGGGTTPTFLHEYWNGAAWSALTVTGSPQNPAGTDRWGALGPYVVTWAIPGDWATTAVNGQTQYWVRIRCSSGASGSGYSAALLGMILAIEAAGATQGRLPAALRMTNNPDTNGVTVTGWGLARLEDNATPQVTAVAAAGGSLPQGVVHVWYSFWDSTRKIGTAPVLIGSLDVTSNPRITVTVGAYPDPSVDKVRIFLEGISGLIATEPDREGDTAKIGTRTLRLVAEYAIVSGANNLDDLAGGTLAAARWTTIDVTRYGDGPYVASSIPTDEYGGRPKTTHGTYLSCCEHQGSALCFGSLVEGYERRVVASHPGNPYCFPADERIGKFYWDLPGDGQHAVAIRSLGRVVVAVLTGSVWAGVGHPASGGFTWNKIGDVGGVAKGACVVAGQRLFFLGATTLYVTDGTSVQDAGAGIRDLIRGATRGALAHAVGAYNPTREVLAFALPGLQAQASGGAGPGETLNDGLLQLGLITRRWTLGAGHLGCFAASLGVAPINDTDVQLCSGGYWGRVHMLDFGQDQHSQSGAVLALAAITASSTTTVRAASGILDAATDRRQLGELVWVRDATNGWQGRLITSTDGTDLTVKPAFTAAPTVTSGKVGIGVRFLAWESGDWTFGDPFVSHLLRRVQPMFEAAVPAGTTIDVAVNADDVAVASAWRWGPRSITSAEEHRFPVVIPDAEAGLTQRLRFQEVATGARAVWRHLHLAAEQKGHPHGG